MDNYDSYLQGWRKRAKNYIIQTAIRKSKAREEALELAHILTEKYGAKRVYLFGSLSNEAESFNENSDIALAAEGLDGSKYFRILAALQDSTEFQVDLVRLECYSEALRESILKEGRLLTANDEFEKGPEINSTCC